MILQTDCIPHRGIQAHHDRVVLNRYSNQYHSWGLLLALEQGYFTTFSDTEGCVKVSIKWSDAVEASIFLTRAIPICLHIQYPSVLIPPCLIVGLLHLYWHHCPSIWITSANFPCRANVISFVVVADATYLVFSANINNTSSLQT